MPLASLRRIPAIRIALLALAVLACGGQFPTDNPIVDIIVNPSSIIMQQNQAVRLRATPTDHVGSLTGYPVTFESSDETIVTVDEFGLVTSVGPAGTAAIRVSSQGFSKNVLVVVRGIPTTMEITPTMATIAQGETVQLKAVVLDALGDEVHQAINYFSGDPAKLRVSLTGLVTSLGPHGEATIVAKTVTHSATATITITQVVSGIHAVPERLRLTPGEQATLRPSPVDAVGVPMHDDGRAYAFSSSDEAIATVGQDGTVRAVGPLGEATITVESGGYSTTVPVRVAGVPTVTAMAGQIEMPGAYGIAFATDGTAYAVSMSDGVSRVDHAALGATQIAVDITGLDLAIAAGGTRAYVPRREASRVDLVDLVTGSVLASSETLFNNALTVALTDDELTLYLGTFNGVLALDAATLAIEQAIDVGTVIHLARHPSRPLLYATGNTGQVAEIDLTSRSVVRTILLDAGVQGVAVSPDESRLYVADEWGSIRVVDLETGTQVGSIPLPMGPYGLAWSPDGKWLYASMPAGGAVAIVDPFASEVAQTIDVPGTPRRLAFSPDGTVLLVASEAGGVVVLR